MVDKVKKVIFVLPSYSAGGAERVMITLMNGIDRRCFKPEFICFRRNGALKKLIKSDIVIHDIGSYRKIYLGFWPLLRMLRLIKPDVVVTTMAHTNFLLLLLKPFLPKTRLIVREAITPSFIFETMKVGWFVKILYKILYPRADLVVSPSQRIIDEFESILKLNTGHHKLLYNPVDESLLQSSAMPVLRENHVEKGKVYFIAAGRMHPQKGFDQLIDALPSFNCDFDWCLTILGGGRERPYLEKLIEKHNLQGKVFLPGFTSTPSLYISEADCFLMPSRFEGLPNVVLESLSVGTPVIATSSSGGVNEIANFANTGDVKVADNMEEFVEFMESVKPYSGKIMRKVSLLPKEFKIDTAIDRFMKMIDALDEFDVQHIKELKKKKRK